jgi:hypothetical protein
MYYFNRLDPRDQSVLKRHLKRGINFLSPTLAPANKNEKTGELESFSWALDYYKNVGLEYAVMQPKFMGSRCQLYLYSDEDSFAISRNGFPIRGEFIGPVLDYWKNKVFAKFPNAKFVLVDGELCPWSALGKNLIEKDFKPIFYGNKQEIQELELTGFFAKLRQEELKAQKYSDEFREYILANAYGELTNRQLKELKKPLIEKYGHFTFEKIANLLKVGDVQALMENPQTLYSKLDLYAKQVNIYGSDYPVIFEPFSILKIDEQVLPYDNYLSFNSFSNRPCKLIDLTNSKDCLGAETLYQTWLSNPNWFGNCIALEGVVIKPLDAKNTSYSPGFKVRNSEYLRIVYGPNYDLEQNYSTIYQNKRISKKLKLAMREHELGVQMLHCSRELLQSEYKDVSANNFHSSMVALPLFVDFFRAEYQLRSVDPRL